MFKFLLLFLFVFPLKPVETAEPPLVKDETIKFMITPEKPVEGDLVTIRVTTTAKAATWILAKVPHVEAGSAKLVDCPIKVDPNEGGLKLTLAAPFLDSGIKSQEFLLYCVVDGKVGTVILPVATRSPQIIPPQPPPGPVTPTDPLAAALQAAYTADPGDPVIKAAAVKALIELYKASAALAANTNNTTATEYFDAVAALAANKVPAGVLVSMRAKLKAELLSGMPDDADAALTDATRKSIESLFTKLAAALSVVK